MIIFFHLQTERVKYSYDESHKIPMKMFILVTVVLLTVFLLRVFILLKENPHQIYSVADFLFI